MTMPTKMLSRRAVFRVMAAGAVACGAAPGARAQTYRPQPQVQLTHAAAHYQDQPRGNEACGGCPYFILPNRCVVVEGDISPNGWCSMFTQFSPLDRGAHS